MKHLEWELPSLILVDGGKNQLAITKKVLEKHNLKIPILAVAKGPTRKKLDIFTSFFSQKEKNKWDLFLKNKKNISFIRDEAHRFAIDYHRKLRANNFLKR